MRGNRPGTLLLGAFLLAWGLAGFVFGWADRTAATDGAEPIAALFLEKEKIANTLAGHRRVLFAGGSNVLFGISAEAFAAATGTPAVNLGIPATLHSQEAYLSTVGGMARAGDIVVLSLLAWVLDHRDDPLVGQLVLKRIGKEVEDLPRLPWRSLPTYKPVLGVLTSERVSGNQIWPLNAHGDLVACSRNVSGLAAISARYIPERLETDLLTHFAGQLRARGATLVLTLPWTLVNGKELGAWERRLERVTHQLASVAPVIASDPKTILLTENQHFCDSPMHLDAAGRAARTADLARALAPYLAPGGAKGLPLPAGAT